MHIVEIRFTFPAINDALIPAANLSSFPFTNCGAIMLFHEKELQARRSGDANAAAFERFVAHRSQIHENALSEQGVVS
jgi:hypothetical protein